VLHTLVALPEHSPSFGIGAWEFYFERLISEGRAARASVDGRNYWVAAERAKTFSNLFPDARFEPQLADVETAVPNRDDVLLTLVTGWMSHLGPVAATELAEILGIPAADIFGALLRMEASGTVLRGNFSGAASRAGAPAPHEQETEWCERRLPAYRGHFAQAD
jgi:ATP-dependent Lhr-like helicase